MPTGALTSAETSLTLRTCEKLRRDSRTISGSDLHQDSSVVEQTQALLW
jgi:hypothetical protein